MPPFFLRRKKLSDADYSLVSREVWPYLTGIVILALVLQYFLGPVFSLPVWLVFILLAYVFRDPRRAISSEPLAIVSPVDGCIVSIDTISNPYLDGESVCVLLQMNKTGAYRLRSPVEGKVIQQWYLLPGDPLPKLQGAVGRLQVSHWIQTDEGGDVVLSMRKNSRFFRPHCAIQVGERIGQGQRCGMIPMGSQVAVYLPVNATMKHESGACLKAGSDIMAYLPHESD
jgi:phosphatidylserine decarboxylase